MDYSLSIQAGNLVRLAGDIVAMPLMEALFEHLVRKGAHYFDCLPDRFAELFFEQAKDHQLRHVSPIARTAVEKIDASIEIWTQTNT